MIAKLESFVLSLNASPWDVTVDLSMAELLDDIQREFEVVEVTKLNDEKCLVTLREQEPDAVIARINELILQHICGG